MLNSWPARGKNYHSRKCQVEAYETVPLSTPAKILNKKPGEEFLLIPPSMSSLAIITSILRRKSWTNWKLMAFLGALRKLSLQGRLSPWSQGSSKSDSKHLLTWSKPAGSISWLEYSNGILTNLKLSMDYLESEKLLWASVVRGAGAPSFLWILPPGYHQVFQ